MRAFHTGTAVDPNHSSPAMRCLVLRRALCECVHTRSMKSYAQVVAPHRVLICIPPFVAYIRLRRMYPPLRNMACTHVCACYVVTNYRVRAFRRTRPRSYTCLDGLVAVYYIAYYCGLYAIHPLCIILLAIVCAYTGMHALV